MAKRDYFGNLILTPFEEALWDDIVNLPVCQHEVSRALPCQLCEGV